MASKPMMMPSNGPKKAMNCTRDYVATLVHQCVIGIAGLYRNAYLEMSRVILSSRERGDFTFGMLGNKPL
jgi:hypothetical protein